MVFLALLLVAVQLLLNLYLTSVVNAAGYDAARVAAGAAARGDPSARLQAEDRARRMLGRHGNQVTFDWTRSDDDTVVLRLQARNPAIAARTWAGSLGFDTIDRTVRVRVERFQ